MSNYDLAETIRGQSKKTICDAWVEWEEGFVFTTVIGAGIIGIVWWQIWPIILPLVSCVHYLDARRFRKKLLNS